MGQVKAEKRTLIKAVSRSQASSTACKRGIRDAQNVDYMERLSAWTESMYTMLIQFKQAL